MSTAKELPKELWFADAANIDASAFDLETYIAITSCIDEFISSNKFVVAAPKGYGKTLLLKYRRLSNRDRYDDVDPLVIPQNIEIDSFENAIPFDANFLSYLENQTEWENLWQISIGLSLIINYAIKANDTEFIAEFFDHFRGRNNRLSSLIGITEKIEVRIREKSSIAAYLRNQANPSSLLTALLTSSLTDLRSSIGHSLDTIHTWCTAIARPVFLYVDQIDQGVKEFPLKLWKNAQNGVVGAIFRLHNPNKHIKVYSSIRSEAWESCEGELYSQYSDYVCTLDYTEDDLRRIFEHAVRTYETERIRRSIDVFKKDPIHAFIGLEKIVNRWGDEEEDVFKYMLRHSLRRPRDLILFGGGVHTLYKKDRLNEEEFCSLVNRIPGEEIGKQYLLETLRFSESLRNVNLQRFFTLTHKNIFTLDEMIEICSRYNSGIECNAKSRHSNYSEACSKCTSANHIFCDLYRIGLLGIIKNEQIKADKSRYQYFKTPGHIRSERLPNSQFYLFHPAMDFYIKEEQANNLFSPVRGIILGQGRKWVPKYDALILLAKVDEVFRTCGITVPQPILDAHRTLVDQVTVAEPFNPNARTQSQNTIVELKQLISSDGLLSATQFVTNIFGALEKLQGLLK
jgi:hypothetical protein